MFKFVDPDTNHVYSATTKQDLIHKILSYRSQNRLPSLQAIEAVVENYLCNLPENMGACEQNNVFKRGLFPAIKGGIAILQSYLYDKFASQEVADARADQCSKCPFNIYPDKPALVELADNIAIACTKGRKSKYHNLLGNCEVCTCPLRAKVFYDGEVDTLTTDQVREMKTVNCWQLSLLKK